MKNDFYCSPIDVVNWLSMKKDLEFFKNVEVVPFGDIVIVHPKDMKKEAVIKILKKYWSVHLS